MGQAGMFGLGDGVPRLRRGLRVTHLGDERLVLDPASGVVHTVRGPAVAALDRILSGSGAPGDEVVAALVASGIVEAPGITRRQALSLPSAALVLVASATLPSAIAAASGPSVSVSDGSGDLQLFAASEGSDTYSLYRLGHSSSGSSPIERTFIIGSVARRVELVLVGAGGSGGLPDTSADANNDYETVFAGGGGGGEVVEVDLGMVQANTSLLVRVAGTPAVGGDGGITDLLLDGSVVVEARGGGVGGSASSSASSGGSGGGGASIEAYRTAAGSTEGGRSDSLFVSATVTRSLSGGGVGVAGAGGGGGGATGGSLDGSGTTGGDGGGGKDISGFFLGANVGGLPSNVGGGGGGAGTSRGTTSGGGGRAARIFEFEGDLTSSASEDGDLGSGGGGGAGASQGRLTSNPGVGGSGVAWVRIKTN